MTLFHGLIVLAIVLVVVIGGGRWWCTWRTKRESGVTTAILFYQWSDAGGVRCNDSARMQHLFGEAQKALQDRRNIVLLFREFRRYQELAEELGVTEAQVPALVLQYKKTNAGLTSTAIAPPVRDLQHMVTLITSFALFQIMMRR